MQSTNGSTQEKQICDNPRCKYPEVEHVSSIGKDPRTGKVDYYCDDCYYRYQEAACDGF